MPGGSDGGDEEAGREGRAPQELGDGGEEGSRVRRLGRLAVAGHFSADVADAGFVFGPSGGAGFAERRSWEVGGAEQGHLRTAGFPVLIEDKSPPYDTSFEISVIVRARTG